jgi:cell division protein FtsX
MDLELVTKDQALLTLQQRLPDIAKSFEAYGIKNPLPTTIYVRFDDQQEYERLQTIVQRYNDVLEQGESIDSQQTFSQQQYRITQTINLIAMVRMMMLVLMVAL